MVEMQQVIKQVTDQEIIDMAAVLVKIPSCKPPQKSFLSLPGLTPPCSAIMRVLHVLCWDQDI